MKASYSNKVGLAPAGTSGIGKASTQTFAELMNILIKLLTRFGLLRKDLDYHLVRASMGPVPKRSWLFTGPPRPNNSTNA